MKTDRELSALFQRFAGSKVSVKEKTVVVTVGGKSVAIEEYRLNRGDNVIAEVNRIAKRNGLTMRYWLPDSYGTPEHRSDRVNVNIEKAKDGVWRIQPKFTIG